ADARLGLDRQHAASGGADDELPPCRIGIGEEELPSRDPLAQLYDQRIPVEVADRATGDDIVFRVDVHDERAVLGALPPVDLHPPDIVTGRAIQPHESEILVA